MLCLSVEINGEVTTVAGAVSAETVTASVEIFPSVGESWLRVSGDVVSDDVPCADAQWLGQALKVGDVVVVRLVQSDAPVAPTLTRSDANVSGADGLQLVCSFCGKSQAQVKKLYAGTKAMICNDCLGFMQQIAAEDGA
jgi:hypothetical protein